MITFSFGGKEFETGRVIGDVGNEAGPTVVFIGGIHGNEPTGVIAIREVFSELAQADIPMNGRMIGLVGNMKALQRSQRQIARDLNRSWNHEFLYLWNSCGHIPIAGGCSTVGKTPEIGAATDESREQLELYSRIDPLLKDERFRRLKNVPPKLFFVDLHTTSSPSVPFIAINDQLDNRRFALKFPVPTVLGIEEYLEGPLLSLLNDQGHVALAFEAGQHQDPDSLGLHKSFIYGALVYAGVIERDETVVAQHLSRLQLSCRGMRGIFEVVFRQPVVPGDQFVMKPGFKNFSEIEKGRKLADTQWGTVVAHRAGRIFMPLYQASGTDGFFIVRRVPAWALSLSVLLRRINFESLLVLLPGVSRSKIQTDALVVNKRVARLLATELFHLLGYRRKHDDGTEMIFSRREIEKANRF